MAAEITSLREAVGSLVHDGDTVAMEGFTHLIPHAAGHEVIRQGRRDLTLVRMTPDVIYDQLIGAGCAQRLVFSWGGNPGVGSLNRFRDAVEHGWPRPLAIEEHSHAGMAARYVAGASGLPFAVLRGYVGTDLVDHTATIAPITCPFTGEVLTALPALNPDVAVIHAQQADRDGNVQLWGLVGVQREAVLSARRAIVTVEEVVDHLEARPGAVVLPAWVIDAVCEVPGGAHPSYAMGYGVRDNPWYRAWDDIARDRAAFTAWIEQHVLGTADFSEFCRSAGITPGVAAPA
jgi:glutaconate CoA-transferase, subunit A